MMRRRVPLDLIGRWLSLALVAGAVALCGAAWAQAGSEKIVASVNGEYITEGEFFDRLQRLHWQDFISSTAPLAVRGETSGQILMNALISERLVLQWAAKTNQMPTEAEINSDLENAKKQPAVAQALAQKQITEDALRYDIKVQRARFNIATTSASVSPADVEAYYKQHIANYTTPERWGLAAIRTSKPENLPKIAADLKANKPFADIARAYSEDEKSRMNGGGLGTVAANSETLPAPLREAIKKLKVGETTPPIKLDMTGPQGKPAGAVWFIVRLVSKTPESVRPFAEIKDQIERLALLEKAGGYQVADKKILQFRLQSDVKINLPGYENLQSTPKK